MKCLEGCGNGTNNRCARDEVCPRVQNMAAFVSVVCQNGGTTTIPEIAAVGELENTDQWRDRFRDAVAEVLGIEKFVYEQGRVNGVDTRAVRRVAILPRDP